MRLLKIFSALLLVTLLTTTGFAAGDKGQGKTKIGASGGVSDNEDKKPEDKKPKVKIGATGAVKDAEKVDNPTKVAPPPPPPPSLSRIAITTNAPNAEVLVNNKRYKADINGIVRDTIDLKPGTANITVQHPDFEPKTETISLKKGEGIVHHVPLISKYGEIKLGGIPPEAKLFIDNQELTADKFQRDGVDVLIGRIPVGARKLKITHPDYITREENIEFKPGDELVDAKGLVLATSDLTVHSVAGAEVYIDGENKGKVLPDGNVVINGIKPGEREIRLVKDGYQEAKLKESLLIGAKELAIKLMPIPNSGEFFDPFNSGLNRWDSPSDWKIENAKLIVKGNSKLGFPKNANFRDFDAQFSLKMVNGKGIAWAMRIQGGGKNYYLFYLAGPQSNTPNQLRTYICRDGKLELNNYQNSVSTAVVTLTPKDIYTVRLKVRGNKMETFIKPETGPEAGREQPLDVFIDETNQLTYGNIGFSTINGEEAIIDDFGIKPIESAEEKAAK